MREKILVDREYIEQLEKSKQDWEEFCLRIAAYVRDSLSYGVLIPNNDDEETRIKIEDVKTIFEIVEEICNDKHLNNPAYSLYEKKAITDKHTSLRLVLNK